MLTTVEKSELMEVLAVIYDGQHTQFYSLKNSFNEKTVEIVEQALSELAKCNANMKSLVVGLAGGAALGATGWLRKALQEVSRYLRDDSLQFDGLACRSRVAANYKTAIILSAM